jgi:hypothetical protein
MKLASAKSVPAAAVQHGGRWASQPYGIAIGDTKDGKDRAEEVADERRVKPCKLIATNEGEGNNNRYRDETPYHSPAI